MTNEFFISIFLDKRRPKKNSKYPVKLRVFTPQPRKQVLYPTKFEFTIKEFESIWETKKPRSEHKQTRLILSTLEGEAIKVAEKLPVFTFEEFENIMYGSREKGLKTINYWYQKKIKECKDANRYGTVTNYDSSIKSLIKFSNTDVIYFKEINKDWLMKYQNWMTQTEKKSLTTVGIYLRPLRAIFNDAIAAKVIKDALYPFSKRLYKIPAPSAKKDALNEKELKLFFEYEPNTPEQKRAKDFWFFSFFCNGMNPKDIAYLKWSNICNDKLTFSREKTKNTDSSQSEISIFLNDRAKEILLKYGTKDKAPDDYVFTILTSGSSGVELERQKNNFTRYVNQHLKKLFKQIGIERNIRYGVGRHSFANYVLNSNISIEMISEALGHTNIKTTQRYLNGFSDDAKRELSERLNF